MHIPPDTDLNLSDDPDQPKGMARSNAPLPGNKQKQTNKKLTKKGNVIMMNHIALITRFFFRWKALALVEVVLMSVITFKKRFEI